MSENGIGETRSPWPEQCLGAVSLTFDDGLRSHLATAIPMLDEYGLNGTFYLNPPREGNAADWSARLAPWRVAAGNGHEIGNHSLTHPCSENFAFKAGARGLEHMTLDEIESDVLEAERAPGRRRSPSIGNVPSPIRVTRPTSGSARPGRAMCR